ncbi:aminoglycoside adenylyltransferase domain-containing protein [Deinococcus sp.]|uniref:aminoglycoside adenylyltransferase domain-containing protein n=1 Tax=Deinococcus sp. TaxID=47478 RepID=UPI003C7E3039
MTHPTPFPDLNDVLAQFTAGLVRLLGPELLALYLQGSFALGDADEGSDVDFLAVVRFPLTSAQAETVQAMHRTIFDLPSPWAQHLEGSYFPAELLRRPDPASTPIPYLDNGSRTLEDSDHDNSLVVRWVTREHGISMYGPPALELIEVVTPEALRAEILNTLHRWGAALLTDPDELNNGWRQPHVVMSIARMLHSLNTGAIHSKLAGTEWASRNLDFRWTPLLKRAWNGHSRQFLRYYEPADPVDLHLTQQFIRSALDGAPLKSAD